MHLFDLFQIIQNSINKFHMKVKGLLKLFGLSIYLVLLNKVQDFNELLSEGIIYFFILVEFYLNFPILCGKRLVKI